MKASDVFRESQPVFGEKAPFAQAFPQIETVRIEVEETGRGVGFGRSSGRHTSIYTERYLGEFVDCSNTLCYNGGVSIGTMLHEAVRKGETTFEASEICRGYEGSPQGRRRYGKCMNTFQVKGEIVYKDQAAA
jgi:hypothetical protein